MTQPQTNQTPVDPQQIDQRVFDLYDEYCHGRIERREFLTRSAAITVGGTSCLWMAQALFPRYAEAQQISFTDPRMKATYVDYPSPGGTSGQMRGYLVQPAGEGAVPGGAGHPREPWSQPAHRGRGPAGPASPASSRWRPTGCRRSAAIPGTTTPVASSSVDSNRPSSTRT